MNHPEVLAGINWHDAKVTALTEEIADSYAGLGTALSQDVRPQDIRIGGRAVQDALDRTDPYWAVNFVPNASVTLEHWSNRGDVTVRIAKERADEHTRRNAGLLARQVRGTGNWLPRVADKRTAKIAQMAGASSLITVDVFAADAPTDEHAFREMRGAADSDARGEQGFRERLYLGEASATPLNKKNVVTAADWMARSKYGWAYMAEARNTGVSPESAVIESFRVEAAAEPTLEEYLEAAQPLVDKKVDELMDLVTSLRVAVPVVKYGRRVRPTEPQHFVRV